MSVSRQQIRRQGKRLFDLCLPAGRLDEDRLRRLVQAIRTRRPRGSLALLADVQRRARLAVQRSRARVEMAVPLTPALQAEVQARLTRMHGDGLVFEFVVNPALLGGLRIQVGDDVYDGSVRGRLQRLEQRL